MQNDFGNKTGNTTVIAPVTTHSKSVKYDKNINKYYIELEDDKIKYLDYYEVPLEIEPSSKELIYGFVNIAHIHEIDRKRICKDKSAIITNKCMNAIRNAIQKNIR